MKLKDVATVALDGQSGDAWMLRSGALAGALSYLPIANSWAITITKPDVFKRETLFEILEQSVEIGSVRGHGAFGTIIGEHLLNLELSDLDGLVIGLDNNRPDLEHG